MEGYRSYCEVKVDVCYKIAKRTRQLDLDRKEYEYQVLRWLKPQLSLFSNTFIPKICLEIIPTQQLPQIAYNFIQGESNIYNNINRITIQTIAKDLSMLHYLDLQNAPIILKRQSQLSAFQLFDAEVKPSDISGSSSVQIGFERYKAKLLDCIRDQDSPNVDKYYFLHGDLKPQNLIMKPDDRLSVIDFEDAYISNGIELELSLLFGNCKWNKEMIIIFLETYQISVNIELLNQYILIKMFSKISGDISLKYSETCELTCDAIEKEFEDWNFLLENPIKQKPFDKKE